MPATKKAKPPMTAETGDVTAMPPVSAKKSPRKTRATGTSWVLPLPRKHKGKIPLKVIRAAVQKVYAEWKAEMAAKGIIVKPWRPGDPDEGFAEGEA